VSCSELQRVAVSCSDKVAQFDAYIIIASKFWYLFRKDLHKYMYIFTHVYIYACIHIHIYIYIQMYTKPRAVRTIYDCFRDFVLVAPSLYVRIYIYIYTYMTLYVLP